MKRSLIPRFRNPVATASLVLVLTLSATLALAGERRSLDLSGPNKFTVLRDLFRSANDAITPDDLPRYATVLEASNGRMDGYSSESPIDCLYSSEKNPGESQTLFIVNIWRTLDANSGPLFPPQQQRKLLTFGWTHSSERLNTEAEMVRRFWGQLSDIEISETQLRFVDNTVTHLIRKTGTLLTFYSEKPANNSGKIEISYGYCFPKNK